MTNRLVDVLDQRGTIIHTYPITVEERPDTAEGDYLVKALAAAAHGQLVPDEELCELTAQMHVSRGGQLEPLGDTVEVDSQTRLGLEQEVREQAYLLWERDGRREGTGDFYWLQALEQHLRDRSYVRWQQQGSPEGSADADWQSVENFERQ